MTSCVALAATCCEIGSPIHRQRKVRSGQSRKQRKTPVDATGASKKTLQRSGSAPAPVPKPPAWPNPLDDRQPLCTVNVFERNFQKWAIGGDGRSRLVSKGHLPFVLFERGLEWEQKGVAARLPPHPLPPLTVVLQKALDEFPELENKLDEVQESRRRRATAPKQRISYPVPVNASLDKTGPRLPLYRDHTKELLKPIEKVPAVPATPSSVKNEKSMDRSRTRASSELERKSTTSEAAMNAVMKNVNRLANEKEAEAAAAAAQALEPPLMPWDEAHLRAIFKKFDVDKDQEVHLDDLGSLLRYLGLRTTDEEMLHLVRLQTQYNTINWEEFMDLLRSIREKELTMLKEEFLSADKDSTGLIELDELFLLLSKLGYAPTRQTALEALEETDEDGSNQLNFKEFEGLLHHLRTTEGFSRVDVDELKTLFAQVAGGADKELATIEIYRILIYRGYPAESEQVARIAASVDADNSGRISFLELLKVIKRYREMEKDSISGVMEKYSKPGKLAIVVEDLGLALDDIGYFVSEDAVYEILDSLGECESMDSLTLEELCAFLRSYRRAEGFTKAELEELKQVFEREDRDKGGAVSALELGRILRWFGVAVNLQQQQRLVEEIDFDGSGELEIPEFVKLMRRHHLTEAKQRRKFLKHFDKQKTGKYDVSDLTKFVNLLNGSAPNPANISKGIANWRQKLIAEKSLQGMEAQNFLAPTKVNIYGWEKLYREYRLLEIEGVRENAGYTAAEIKELRKKFDSYDEDRSGTVETKELRDMLQEYFPEATHSRLQQQEMQKLLSTVDKDGSGSLDFREFLWLMRACDDARDASDVASEVEIIAECKFTPEEVDGFRQLFSQTVEMSGEVKLGKVQEFLKTLEISFTDENIEKLTEVVRECNPAHRDALRFPHFLKLMKKLVSEDILGVNDAAGRVLRREGTMKNIERHSISAATMPK